MSHDDKPSMEGFLEKHSTGVTRLLGKSRFWCTLQGSCLVYCKENRRSSVVESLLLGDAQMVRKTSNDKHGVQFEIVMKKQKTHVFSAASSEECRNWVKHLQQAMIHNEGARRASMDFRPPYASDSGYEEITLTSDSKPVLAESQRNKIAVPQSGIYADVVDSIRCKSDSFPIPKFTNSSTGEYAEVADVIRPADKSAIDVATRKEGDQPDDDVVYRDNSLYITNKQKEAQEQLEYSEDAASGYSTLDSLNDMESKMAANATKPEVPASSPQPADKRGQPEVLPSSIQPANQEEHPVYAMVNKKGKTKPPPETEEKEPLPSVSDDVREGEGAAIERLDSELKRLPESSAAPVWDSFTADDRKPLEDLKEFLANNRHVCRSSYVRQTSEGDPVEKVKEIIQSVS